MSHDESTRSVPIEEEKLEVINNLNPDPSPIPVPIPIPKTYDSEVDLKGSGSAFRIVQPETEVVIEKYVVSNEEGTCPRVVLNITTPKIRTVDLVLALDSSGSVHLNKHKDLIETFVNEELINVCDECKKDNLSMNVAFVSWDHKIDYRSEMLKNIDSTDIDHFLDNYICRENETTVFNRGIEESMNILNETSHSDKESLFTKQAIILVTGKSEYQFGSDEFNESIKNNTYEIYTVGIDVDSSDSEMMESDLEYIAEVTNGKYYDTSLEPKNAKDKFADAIKGILSDIPNNGSIAYNLTIVDSLYPYLTPDTKSVKVIEHRYDGKTRSWECSSSYNEKTNSLTIEGNRSSGILPNTTYTVSFDTRLNMNLPVEVMGLEQRKNTWNRIERLFKVEDNVPVSSVSYRWYTNKYYVVNLAECELEIRDLKGGVIN